MSKMNNLKGRKFGSWTVLEMSNKKNGVVMWRCQCECGVIRDVRSNSLTLGKSTSCGCKNKKDLKGRKFGSWTVLQRSHSSFWKCQCKCGNVRNVWSSSLTSGVSTSCGCSPKSKELLTTHNLSKTRIYSIYMGIKARCLNKNNSSYDKYGGRNIKICNEWKNDFLNFYQWAIENGYNDTLTIERINVNEGYNPQNCKWIPLKEQSYNKRNSLLIKIENETKCLKQWCQFMGWNDRKFYSRKNRCKEIFKKEEINLIKEKLKRKDE